LPADGVFCFSGDSPYTEFWHRLADGRPTLTFGWSDAADLFAERAAVRVQWEDDGFRTRVQAHHRGQAIPISLQLAGEHNARNALAASSLALALGVAPEAITAGLATLTPIKGRLCPRWCTGVGVIDDTYNANPDSLAAAIDVLTGLSGRRWLILGDLGELGADAEALHEEVGRRARTAGVDRLFSVGVLSAAASRVFGPAARHFDQQPELVQALRAEIATGDRILVKGSRSARMERVVEMLCTGGET
jgi:UDP-N-acetylmuramoyl-tripeptide--D-alanyl-D-alanine ligase